MTSISKRIAALEAVAKAAEAQRRLHDPFICYRPWSMLNDEFYLEYYPEGLYKRPQKIGPIPYDEMVKKLKEYPRHLVCEIHLGWCREWLFAFHYFGKQSEIYTEAQLDRFIQGDISREPALAIMLLNDEMLENLLKCPQFITTTVGDLQNAMMEGK